MKSNVPFFQGYYRVPRANAINPNFKLTGAFLALRPILLVVFQIGALRFYRDDYLCVYGVM
jgi:hypothetical protein